MTPISPVQNALVSALRPPSVSAGAPASKARLVLAGAGGALGAEVLHRLAASGLFAQTRVLVTEPLVMTLPQVAAAPVGLDDIAAWPCHTAADTAVVMFEPPRLTNDRERVFFTPVPAQLPALAHWLQGCGVQTLVVVVPHAPGRLPEALKHGLANLDEHAVAVLGFERVLLVRSAARLNFARATSLPDRLAQWMLSMGKYMIPAQDQPVRPARMAEFIEAALRAMPPGTHVAAPELLHRASAASRQAGVPAPSMAQVVQDWLAGPSAPAQ